MTDIYIYKDIKSWLSVDNYETEARTAKKSQMTEKYIIYQPLNVTECIVKHTVNTIFIKVPCTTEWTVYTNSLFF